MSELSRDEVIDALQAGDARLRDHIDQSIARLALSAELAAKQVELALAAAEKLELERVHRLEQRLDVAADERSRAAEVLRDDMRKTAVAAAEEREKSAAELRNGTDQRLLSLEKQMTTQVDALKEQILALVMSRTEEFRLLRAADARAIDKATIANEERFHAANEWRSQSADRERSQAEAMAKLTSTFVRSDTADAQLKGLRESIESQLGELRRLITDIADKVNKVV